MVMGAGGAAVNTNEALLVHPLTSCCVAQSVGQGRVGLGTAVLEITESKVTSPTKMEDLMDRHWVKS